MTSRFMFIQHHDQKVGLSWGKGVKNIYPIIKKKLTKMEM